MKDKSGLASITVQLMPKTGGAVKPSFSGFSPISEKIEEQLKRWGPAKRGPKTKRSAGVAKEAKELWDRRYTYPHISNWFKRERNDWRSPKAWELLLNRYFPETKGARRRNKRT